MPNSSTTDDEQPGRINPYKVAILALVVIIAALVAALVSTHTQSKVDQASKFIEAIGFKNPKYVGIERAVEAEYPTFTAEAIGDEPVKLWVRTTRNDGMEIQVAGTFRTIASAEQLAHVAWLAVNDWENRPPDLQPSANHQFGQYETLQASYELLAKYNPSDGYWAVTPNKATGWPDK